AERVAVINLGCPKNLVDSEVMLGHLQQHGYDITADLDGADVVVVNTCGFLEASAQESVDTLLSVAQRKQAGSLRAVVAAGCLTQRYGSDSVSALPEVDGFLGVGQSHILPDVIEKVLRGERISRIQGPAAGFEGYGLRLQSTPSHTAYLKISEGCDRNCSFCVIPAIRGRMVSRPVAELVGEARVLASQGVRELILIGQDPTRYGADLGGNSLVPLLEALNGIEDLRWIRLMYLFPDRHAEQVLDAIVRLPRVAKYVDIPLQHVDPALLRSMNRPGSGDEYRALLARARAACPELAVRTSFIVGFPGETEAQFAALLQFVREGELDHVGVFAYSREVGSPAARLPEQASLRRKQNRLDRVMRLQQRVSRRRLRRRIGSRVEVLVEQVRGEIGLGRTAGQAPDVDGVTHLCLSAQTTTQPGDFVLAEVTGAREYDLEARVLELQYRAPRRAPELLRIGVKQK
ncbi:MAG: 30S ribosomal protein S12 methylthiotransferase RimO, partial [Armatimonadetes bacterium]|nr:30S ribosomal protein S12 methylthiotransferase RimO [Armatimonadota bacterium]